MKENGKKKPFYKKWWFWVIVVILLIGAFGSANDDTKKNNSSKKESIQEETPASQTQEIKTKEPETTQKEKADKTVKYSTVITAGYYTGGIQLPSGKYNLKLKSGTGNVMSDSGLNEIFTTDDSMGIDEYNNFYLDNNDTLYITSNLEIEIECADADMESMEEKNNDAAKEKELSAGKYEAGQDFEPGIYDIVYAKGNGNVFVNDGELVNEMMGSGDDMFIQTFKNCPFEEGTTIELSGVSVKLVPSKCDLQE